MRERTIKAYQLVDNSNRLPFIHSVKKEMALSELSYQSRFLSSFIFGKNKQQVELTARQFLLLRINTKQFNEKLLCSAAYEDVIEHELLIKEWRDILIKEGLKVNRFVSSVKFSFYIFKRLAYTLMSIGGLFVKAIRSSNKSVKTQKKYVQFCDLNRNCLPWPGEEKEYTIVNWYINWDGSVKEIAEIHHNIPDKPAYHYKSFKISPANDFICYLSGLRSWIKLISWLFCSFFIALFSLFRGHWINALLFHEAVLGKIISMLSPDCLAQEYLFSISSFSYRPFWTYIAEEKGSRITNYS